MKDMPEAGFRNLDRKYVVGVVLVKDATGYWIASAGKIELYQKNSIFGWCGPWRGSHWIMD